MARDHIVPQQMIRRFAGEDGQLSYLHKPTLQLGTRRKRPKGILFVDDYYEDAASDLDDDVLKAIEQNFARHYDTIAPSNGSVSLEGEPAHAFIRWTASMLARTDYTLAHMQAIASLDDDDPTTRVLMEAFANEVRAIKMDQMIDLIGRRDWKWMRMNSGGEGLVLTDNPVVLTKVPNAQALTVIVPLSSSLACIGGHEADLTAMKTATPRLLNLHLAGWANQKIYACSDAPLIALQADMSAENRFAQSARLPYHGMLERIPDLPEPGPGQAEAFWKQMADGFGPSPLANRRPQ